MRVSDITRKAGVGRATFYAHFRSKDDLLRSQMQRFVLPMLGVLPDKPFLLDCRAFFAHIRAIPHIYKALLVGRQQTGARVIREVLELHLDGALLAVPNRQSIAIPEPLVKRFVISVLLSVSAYMLNSGNDAPAEEMQRLFERLVGSGLSA